METQEHEKLKENSAQLKTHFTVGKLGRDLTNCIWAVGKIHLSKSR